MGSLSRLMQQHLNMWEGTCDNKNKGVNDLLKSCKYCGRIHDSKFDCGRKLKRKRIVKQSEEFRYTSKMKKKSAEIKEDAGYLCEYCLSKGMLTYKGLETHHIEKLTIRPHLALDNDNLICLCRNCHELAERGDISRARLKEIAALREQSPRYITSQIQRIRGTDGGPS